MRSSMNAKVSGASPSIVSTYDGPGCPVDPGGRVRRRPVCATFRELPRVLVLVARVFCPLVLQSDFAILSLTLLGTGSAAGPQHPLVKTAGKYAVSGLCGDLLPVDRFPPHPLPPRLTRRGAGPPA